MKRWLSLITAIALGMSLIGLPAMAQESDLKVYTARGKIDLKYVPDEINVKFRNESKPFRTIKVPAGSVASEVSRYSRRADVEFAEPNYFASASMVPNDPYYFVQWNFKDSAQGGIDLEPVWDETTGSGVTVAILDTGIAYENYGTYTAAPDLAGTHFVPGYDFINNDPHANDDNSHGTHVAGTVAQRTNNSLGVAGAAFGVTLMPVKVLDKKGSGTHAAIANGIYFAADQGAKVINMSLGGAEGSTVLFEAVKYAHEKGVTIVAAAGNDGSGVVSYPAAYDDHVIAVGATGYGGYLAPYSNYGSSLDVVAPGGDTSVDKNGDGYVDGILQNTFDPVSKSPGRFSYYFFQGTSMASPHVAAAAALVLASGAAGAPAEVQNILQSTANDLGAVGRDNSFGHGLIDVAAAVSGTAPPPSENQAPVAADQTVTTSENTSVSLTLTGSDPDGDLLQYFIVSGPTHGTLSGTAPNLIYQPESDYSGSDEFTFRVFDGTDYSAPAAVTITIAPMDPPAVNDPPTVTALSVTTKKDTAISITLKGTDPDNDPLTFAIVSPPSNGSITLSGAIAVYTPNTGFVGKDSFTYSASDGTSTSNIAAVSIRIKSK